jgi:hypothetical protein
MDAPVVMDFVGSTVPNLGSSHPMRWRELDTGRGLSGAEAYQRMHGCNRDARVFVSLRHESSCHSFSYHRRHFEKVRDSC